MESDPGVFTELIKGFGEGEVGAGPGAGVAPLGRRWGSKAAAPPVSAAVPALVQDRPARRVQWGSARFPGERRGALVG